MKPTMLSFVIAPLSLCALGHARADEVFLPQINRAPATAIKNISALNVGDVGAIAVPVKFTASSNALGATPTSSDAANAAQLTQVGVNNLATISQNGSGNLALVSQQGRGNVAVVTHSGRSR